MFLITTRIPVNPDDRDPMDLVQLLGQLLAQSGGQEGLAFVVLLVVLGGVITQVDVHCRQHTQSDRSTISR